MDLKIISSSSKGNSYILDSGSSILLLECGVKFSDIKKALNFDLSRVDGCLLTHSHSDHSKSAKDVAEAGINVWSSQGTFESLKLSGHRFIIAKNPDKFGINEFWVKPFKVIHDAVDPFGYLIYHEDAGYILFVTDTNYIPYNFSGLNQIIVEVNYDQDILDEKMFSGKVNEVVRNRTMNSHLSLETFKYFLSQTDLSQVANIVLIHLSDSNSNERRFIKEIKELTGKTVFAAKSGMSINLSKTPF